jgi:Fe2+ transport system protein B
MGTLDAAAKVLQVGLLGNPNTGKSSLFNRLTACVSGWGTTLA